MQYRYKTLSRQRGFTLIELMVVIVIIAILATLVLPKIMDRPDQARMTKAKHDIGVIVGSLNLYKLDNFAYPTAEQGLEALVVKPEMDPIPSNWQGYQDNLPVDPWGNHYIYRNPGEKNLQGIDVLSLGADGQPDGEGINADIGNWK